MIGQTLGHYKIVDKLGEGGMGEVYRAEDTHLGREVAIKVLPDAVASDAERLARFEREARVLATLNHPNIAAVYSFETSDSGVSYLVMELVEGEDLRERLAIGSIPVEEALHLALQISEALEAAHEHGIVHRDLKPANVKVNPAGQAKVLDFGLAKALASHEPDPASSTLSQSPTLTAEMTQPGVILGTAAYMSPEQAKGLEADRLSDIWSYGVLFWEMLTGERLFTGDSISDTLAAILRDDADIEALPTTTPTIVRKLIARCLDRDPRMRLRDIGEARVGLEQYRGGEIPSPEDEPTLKAPADQASWKRWTPWISAVTFGILAAIVGLMWLRETPPAAQLRQSAIEPPTDIVLRATSGFALSPDGLQLVFVGSDSEGVVKLWVRSLESRQTRPLEGTDGSFAPFWSPDGRHIAFFASATKQLKRIPAAGGVTQVLADGAGEPKGGDWSPDGRIVYTPNYRTGLFEVPADGGKPRPLTELDADGGELSHRWPRFLPDGRTLLFLVQTAEGGAEDDRSRIEFLEASGTRKEVLKVNSSVEYASSGQLLFWRESAIYAQRFDPNKLRIREAPQLVVEGVGLTVNEWSTFSVSHEGTLVYHRAAALPWRLEWRDRAGKLLSAPSEEGDFLFPALSPDGSRVAYVADNTTVWILDLERGTHTRMSFEEADHYTPQWGPEGRWLAYSKDDRGVAGGLIVRRRPSGLGDEELLYSSNSIIHGIDWSPDGRWIAFEEQDDILLLDLETLEARIKVATPGLDFYPAFSPDSQWLAYTSGESGRYEVYVVSVADKPGKWQISSRGGIEPEWGSEGNEIYFRGFDFELRTAEIEVSGGEPKFGVPIPLFTVPGASPGFFFEVGQDENILVRVQPSAGEVENFRLVQNWPALLNEARR